MYETGLFDAEGCFVSCYTKKTHSWTFRISLEMINHPLFVDLHQRYGGCLHIRPKLSQGGYTMATWSILTKDESVRHLIEDLACNSLTKRHQARAIHHLTEHDYRGMDRSSYAEYIRSYNGARSRFGSVDRPQNLIDILENQPLSPSRYNASFRGSVDYLAGIFDGEGCITYSGSYLQVSIAMSEPGPPRLAQEIYGGRIVERLDGMFHWYLRRSEMIPFLGDMSTRCRIKQPQVLQALANMAA